MAINGMSGQSLCDHKRCLIEWGLRANDGFHVYVFVLRWWPLTSKPIECNVSTDTIYWLNLRQNSLWLCESSVRSTTSAERRWASATTIFYSYALIVLISQSYSSQSALVSPKALTTQLANQSQLYFLSYPSGFDRQLWATTSWSQIWKYIQNIDLINNLWVFSMFFSILCFLLTLCTKPKV